MHHIDELLPIHNPSSDSHSPVLFCISYLSTEETNISRSNGFSRTGPCTLNYYLFVFQKSQLNIYIFK